MDKNWFDNLIDDKGNWIVPESGIKNLKDVAPKLYEEVMEEIRARKVKKVSICEKEIEPCCGRPSCDGCKLVMEDAEWEKLKLLDVDVYNKLIEKHGTPWDNGNKKFSLEPTPKEVKDDILTHMANKGCLPKYNSINGEDKSFSRVKGDAPVMAKRDPKDYPKNCNCGKCEYADKCNISCDCSVELDVEEDEDGAICGCSVEDLVWDKITSRIGYPDIDKMSKMLDKEVERETKKTSGFNELTKLVREIAIMGEKNIVDSDLCELYSAYFDQFRHEAKKLLKKYNGFIDKDVFIHLLSSLLFAKFKDEDICLKDKKYKLFDEMYTVRDITKDVIDEICEEEVLSWRNVLMTRKAYSRFVRMFSEFYSKKMSEKMFGTPLDIGCAFPRSWDKF